MAASRKLQGDIDRCMKKVTEGVEQFEDIWKKVHSATNSNQKEKYEADLKKDIKKLQRLRDNIKQWLASGEVKDKTELLEKRKLIETQMERFKVVERETKTKAYSKEGLGAAQNKDPAQREVDALYRWLKDSIHTLNFQVDQFESEIESLLATGKKKKMDKDRSDRIDDLKRFLSRHRYHIEKLEILLRMLNNESVDCDKIKGIKEDIIVYIDESQEADFIENDSIYDDIPMDDLDYPTPEITVGKHILGSHESTDASTPSSVCGSSPAPSPATTTNHSIEHQPQHHERKRSNKSEESRSTSHPIKPQAMRPSNTNSSTSSSGNSTSSLSNKSSSTSVTPIKSSTGSSSQSATTNSNNNNNNSASGLLNHLPSSQQNSTESSNFSNNSGGNSHNNTSNSSSHSSANGPSNSNNILSSNLMPSGNQHSGPSLLNSYENTNSLKAIAQKKLNEVNSSSVSSLVLDPNNSGISNSCSIVVSSTNNSLSINSNPTAVLPSKGVSKAMLEAHVPPSLGMVPLGPVPLTIEHNLQFERLQAAFCHMPQPCDSERIRTYLPRQPCQTPPHYPQAPIQGSDSVEFFQRLSAETLFFIFYYMEGTKAQYLAAKALKKQSWRFHTKFMMWFQRHEEPRMITDEYEQGAYIYFDFETWAQKTKDNFTFEYKFLEDRDLN